MMLQDSALERLDRVGSLPSWTMGSNVLCRAAQPGPIFWGARDTRGEVAPRRAPPSTGRGM